MGDVAPVSGETAQKDVEIPSAESVVAEYLSGIQRFRLDPVAATQQLPLLTATTVLRRHAYREMVAGEVCPYCSYPIGPEEAVSSSEYEDRFLHARCALENEPVQTEDEQARHSRIRYLFFSTSEGDILSYVE